VTCSAPALFLLAAVCLGAAGDSAQPARKVRVALILPGTITDLSWNHGAYEGLKQAARKTGAEIAYQENVADADVERALRDYASRGYDLILAESFNYGEAVLKVARDFPQVKFATATHYKTAPNAAVYDWPAHHGGYLAGMLAALMTKSGKVGFVGGYEVPDIIRIAEGFKLGARAVRPEVQVRVMYTSSWDDVLKGRESAEALLDWGADVLAQAADGPGVGAIKAAQARGAYAIGYVADQNRIAPQTVLTSIVLNKAVAYERLIAEVARGTFQGKPYLFDMLSGGVEMAPYRNVPDEVVARLREAERNIRSGELRVPDIVRSTPP